MRFAASSARVTADASPDVWVFVASQAPAFDPPHPATRARLALLGVWVVHLDDHPSAWSRGFLTERENQQLGAALDVSAFASVSTAVVAAACGCPREAFHRAIDRRFCYASDPAPIALLASARVSSIAPFFLPSVAVCGVPCPASRRTCPDPPAAPCGLEDGMDLSTRHQSAHAAVLARSFGLSRSKARHSSSQYQASIRHAVEKETPKPN